MAVLVLAGCGEAAPVTTEPPASTTPSAPSATPPLTSATPPPTTSAPAKPPMTPTDQRPKGVLVGKVTRGGEGPCYGMVTDDGKEYALYSTAGTKLAEGDTVKIRYEPLRLKIYCGPGEHVSALEITVVK